MVIWLIGLAGAGKTTIGRELHARMRTRNPATVLVDGDAVRAMFGGDLGHTLEDRRANGWRICQLCRFLDRQGIDVVACVLSLFHDQLAWNRATYSSYFEVFVDVSWAELTARDQKGLYSGARAGRIADVVGVDIPFAPPPAADLVLHNEGRDADPGRLAEAVLAAATDRMTGSGGRT